MICKPLGPEVCKKVDATSGETPAGSNCGLPPRGYIYALRDEGLQKVYAASPGETPVGNRPLPVTYNGDVLSRASVAQSYVGTPSDKDTVTNSASFQLQRLFFLPNQVRVIRLLTLFLFLRT